MSQEWVAKVAAADAGGFTAVASTATLDRDGEVVVSGAFTPLPAAIPVHLDHDLRVSGLVGRARPFYATNGDLRVEGKFASTPDAQLARAKVLDGVLTEMSIVFRTLRREHVDGVPHIVSGELLAADLVTIPSNRGTRVLTSRSYTAPGGPSTANTRAVLRRVQVDMALKDAKEAQRLLDELDAAKAAELAELKASADAAVARVRERAAASPQHRMEVFW